MSERFDPRPDPRPDDVPWGRLDPWPPPAGTVLRGAFIELRPVRPNEDAEDLFTALDDDAVWQHVAGRPSSPAQLAQSLTDSMAASGRFPWRIQLVRPWQHVSAGTVVGMSSYLEVSVGDARLEIGWTAYSRAVWAGPVNPEAKLLLLGYAFDELGAGRVQLKTDIRNQRSQQAIARLGATYEGTLRRYQRRADDTIRDTVLFSVLADEWPSVRSGLQDRVAGFE